MYYTVLWSFSYPEVFPCFFLSCKANSRVKLAKTGHSSKLFIIITLLLLLLLLFSTTHCSLQRFTVRSGLDVPSFATRRLHACHHARAPSGGRWNCGQEMSGNFA